MVSARITLWSTVALPRVFSHFFDPHASRVAGAMRRVPGFRVGDLTRDPLLLLRVCDVTNTIAPVPRRTPPVKSFVSVRNKSREPNASKRLLPPNPVFIPTT